MNNRDKAIVEDIRNFRMLSRDQIIGLHFNDLKNPINSANNVLKRLSRDGIIKCSKKYSPYVYFLAESKIKEDSQKIPHFLELADTVIEMRNTGHIPKLLTIEPKYGKKGTVEPDIFCKWLGMPIFIEVQRSTYTAAQMQKKIDLYDNYFYTDDWKREPYQELGKERFPTVILVSSTRYPVKSENFNIIQIPSMSDFYDLVARKQQKQPTQQKPIKASNGGIKFNLN
jgi:hypothetical protein